MAGGGPMLRIPVALRVNHPCRGTLPADSRIPLSSVRSAEAKRPSVSLPTGGFAGEALHLGHRLAPGALAAWTEEATEQ